MAAWETYADRKDSVAGGAAATFPDPIFIGVCAATSASGNVPCLADPDAHDAMSEFVRPISRGSQTHGVVEAPFEGACAA